MRLMLAVAAVCLISMGSPARTCADEIPISQARQMCASGNVGPRTVYGETKIERQNKKIMFDWTCMTLVDGKVQQAFAKYVSPDFCDHSHMANAGLKDCSNYNETRTMFEGIGRMMSHNGMIEFPVDATVNGELVTQYGAGADIWRVQNGKIMDHWDASPPVTTTLKAHDQTFSDMMQQQIDTHKRMARSPMAVAADPAQLHP